MGAAENQCVDPARDHWIEITFNRLIGQRVVQQAFFDQRHEQRTRLTTHPNMHIQRAQSILVRATANRCTRADYTDVPIACRL